MSKTVVLDWSSGWTSADIQIEDRNGKVQYLFWCRGGTPPNMDVYEEKTGFSMVGSLICRLSEGGTKTDLSLLQEDATAVWHSRGQIHEDAITGRCANYPEFGATRHFLLRDMQLTLRFSDVKLRANGGFSRLTMTLQAVPMRGIRNENAQRPHYLPPVYKDCSHIRRGIEPRMCRRPEGDPKGPGSWAECREIGL